MSEFNKLFKGSIGNYKVLDTLDGDQTLYSEFYEEACHSMDGAVKETHHNYLLGAEVLLRLKENRSEAFPILEIGFGIGLGVKCLWDEINKMDMHKEIKVHFISTEIDPALFLYAQKQWSNFTSFPDEIINGVLLKGGIFKKEKCEIKLTILIGDMRETILKAFSKLPSPLSIFQDPFSPKKNPTLWTKEWFLDLKKISTPDTVMSTYGSSVRARKAMQSAGWKLHEWPGFGRKRSATQARNKGQSCQVLIEKLNKSLILPYSDLDLDLDLDLDFLVKRES